MREKRRTYFPLMHENSVQIPPYFPAVFLLSRLGGIFIALPGTAAHKFRYLIAAVPQGTIDDIFDCRGSVHD